MPAGHALKAWRNYLAIRKRDWFAAKVMHDKNLTVSESKRVFTNEFCCPVKGAFTEFQVITTTCAIIIEKTQASIKQWQEAEEQEEAERQAKRERMSEAELAYDDSVRQEEEWIVGDDDMYYESLKIDGLESLASLKIKMVTAQDKGYLKLVDTNKKEWMLDIRGSMEQGWTAVLFNTKKEPKVIDLTTVNRDVVIQYFLYEWNL